MAEFNPHEKQEVERLAGRLEMMASAVRDWNEGDVQQVHEPMDLSPASIHMMRARISLQEDLIEALDTAVASLRGTSKITEQMNDWANWWSEQ